MSSKEPERMYANYASNTTRSFWDNIYFKSNKDDINKIHVQKNINTVQQGPSPDQYYVGKKKKLLYLKTFMLKKKNLSIFS